MPPVEPIRIDTSAPTEEVEREPLFYIDDVEYTIPKKVPARVTVAYLNDVYDHGSEYAVAAGMRDLLGEEAMVALAESPHVTDDHVDGIMAVVEQKLAASADKSMGKSRRGPRR